MKLFYSGKLNYSITPSYGITNSDMKNLAIVTKLIFTLSLIENAEIQFSFRINFGLIVRDSNLEFSKSRNSEPIYRTAYLSNQNIKSFRSFFDDNIATFFNHTPHCSQY